MQLAKVVGLLILTTVRLSIWLGKQPVQESQRQQQGSGDQKQPGGDSIPFWHVFMPRFHVLPPIRPRCGPARRYSPSSARTIDRQHGTVLPAGQRKGQLTTYFLSVRAETQRPTSDVQHIPGHAADSERATRHMPGHTLSLRRIQSRCSLLTIRCTWSANSSSHAGSIERAYRSWTMFVATPLRALRRKR